MHVTREKPDPVLALCESLGMLASKKRAIVVLSKSERQTLAKAAKIAERIRSIIRQQEKQDEVPDNMSVDFGEGAVDLDIALGQIETFCGFYAGYESIRID